MSDGVPGEGRVVALDFGSARCGVAASDPTRLLVTPMETVLRANTRKGIDRLGTIVREREAVAVVIGLPLGLAGHDTAQTTETRAFAARLEAKVAPVPVLLHDERFTTAIAARTGGDASEDSRAAAVLLEDWLAQRARPGADSVSGQP